MQLNERRYWLIYFTKLSLDSKQQFYILQNQLFSLYDESIFQTLQNYNLTESYIKKLEYRMFKDFKRLKGS